MDENDGIDIMDENNGVCVCIYIYKFALYVIQAFPRPNANRKHINDTSFSH